MTLKYLLDENVDKVYNRQFVYRNPTLMMWVVGDPGAPPRGTLDPEILYWCEEYNFILITNNRTSMPGHLAEHITQGRNIPGIFILNEKLTVGQTIDELQQNSELRSQNSEAKQALHLALRLSLCTSPT